MRRFCLIATAAAVLWAALVATTGGFTVTLMDARLSSRSPVNAFLVSLVAGTAWMMLARRRWAILADDLRWFAAPGLAGALATVIVVTGLVFGAGVAGGSDAYGYVSQADAWAAGTVRFDEPLIREFAGRVPRDVFVPLGYQGVGEDGTIVPMYPPGLPMVMAMFKRLAGRDAVFYVVPLLAGVAIWATYMMGLRLGGRVVGLLAAALLATSPSFLFQLTAAPMSDVPVTAWWALVLALATFDRLGAAWLSGAAASLAILTRPNLAPLALIPVVTVAWEALRRHTGARRALTWAAVYSAGVVPGCLAIATLHAVWYGSPLTSGYGSLGAIYQWQNLLPNLARYPAWIVESQTPLVLLAFAAPWLTRARLTRARVVAASWIAFIVAVLASYLLYEAFNAWWFVRFMLPAFPPLFVLTAASIVEVASRLSYVPRVLTPAVLAGVMAWHGLNYARHHDAFRARSEKKYAAAAEYVGRRLPEKAVVLSMQHSGSVRYYAGRATVRVDLIPPSQLDATLSTLASSGYRPYILLESWEVPQFQKRYAGFSPLGPLDWPPAALLRDSSIRIYDPADLPAYLAGRPPLTEIVP